MSASICSTCHAHAATTACTSANCDWQNCATCAYAHQLLLAASAPAPAAAETAADAATQAFVAAASAAAATAAAMPSSPVPKTPFNTPMPKRAIAQLKPKTASAPPSPPDTPSAAGAVAGVAVDSKVADMATAGVAVAQVRRCALHAAAGASPAAAFALAVNLLKSSCAEAVRQHALNQRQCSVVVRLKVKLDEVRAKAKAGQPIGRVRARQVAYFEKKNAALQAIITAHAPPEPLVTAATAAAAASATAGSSSPPQAVAVPVGGAAAAATPERGPQDTPTSAGSGDSWDDDEASPPPPAAPTAAVPRAAAGAGVVTPKPYTDRRRRPLPASAAAAGVGARVLFPDAPPFVPAAVAAALVPAAAPPTTTLSPDTPQPVQPRVRHAAGPPSDAAGGATWRSDTASARGGAAFSRARGRGRGRGSGHQHSGGSGSGSNTRGGMAPSKRSSDASRGAGAP